ncbi:type II secretion system F family protein [Actinotalea sp. JY-7876]|uniref:type II secretion system F family protein n=1 Tax=Actinotalea sp. JY-7876 TaxID=2758442 RepID=UPI0015F491FA|nr:type II secretion system F family protein [Actinotalea sp. JY-7876]
MSRAQRLGRAGGAGGATGNLGGAQDLRGAQDCPDLATVLDLVAAACAAGAGVPAALVAVGAALPGDRGRLLVRAGGALALGAAWDEAWQSAREGPVADGPGAGDPGAGDPGADVIADALRASWETGAAPGPALQAAARTARRERHARAMEAAGRLGVRLVLPLGLCYLPAFVLVGLVPVLVSMASGGLSR